MEERELQQLLINILRSELTCTALYGEIKQKLTSDVVNSLYKLSKKHDLAHIVSAALGRLGLMGNDEISAKLQREEMLSVYRCERIKYEYQSICKTLDQANIPYIPLKGSVIRPYYPYDSMRTSCDIDILVKEENLNAAQAALISALHYKSGDKGEHDISMHSPSGISLELHYCLVDVIERFFDEILNKAWEYAEPKQNSEYKFSDDFLMFYHIAHTAKHFIIGGCGIRPLMDLWIMEHKMNIDRHICDKLLIECGLDRFSKAAFALADVWFEGKEHTSLTLDMQDYIMSAGVYGNIENKIAISQAKRGNGLKHLLSKVFLPYEEMESYYPSIRNNPKLFPLYQVRRWFRIVFRKDGVKNTMKHIKMSNSVTDERRNNVKNMCDELGI